jgi:stage II sporulation protein D
VQRRRFLHAAALAAVAFGYPQISVAQDDDDSDPAISAPANSLRVLLGPGNAIDTPGGGFTFNGQPYRGTFARQADGTIVNTVRLEEYLYSVVPREMPSGWPAAALQAQAICARTYVLQRSNPRRTYDLVPSEADQVYGGVAFETPAGRAAVDATAGSVLRFAEDFAQVMYSSCCGGHTEASSDAWNGPPFAYLRGVVCPYCTASPNYRWDTDVSLDSVAQAFQIELAPFGTLHDVRVSGSDPSGRVRAFDLVADRGTVNVKGSTFRLRVGPRTLRSLLIVKMSVTGAQAAQTVSIEGGGLGHGVGLCQWGARGLALTGGTARDILMLYFPGTQLGND